MRRPYCAASSLVSSKVVTLTLAAFVFAACTPMLAKALSSWLLSQRRRRTARALAVAADELTSAKSAQH